MRVHQFQNEQLYLTILFLDIFLNTIFSNTLSPNSSLKMAANFYPPYKTSEIKIF